MMIPIRNLVTLVQVTAANKHSVHSIGESAEHKGQINSSAAHNANKLNIGCILLSGNSSKVGGAVRSPIAHKAQNSWLEIRP
jgi:hypothetical protein